MFTDDKITEIFCLADDFCKFSIRRSRNTHCQISHAVKTNASIIESRQCPRLFQEEVTYPSVLSIAQGL